MTFHIYVTGLHLGHIFMLSGLSKSLMKVKTTQCQRPDTSKEMEEFSRFSRPWDRPSAWSIRAFLSLLYYLLSPSLSLFCVKIGKNEQSPRLRSSILTFCFYNRLLGYGHHLFCSTLIKGGVDCWTGVLRHGWALLDGRWVPWCLMLRVHSCWIVSSDFQLRELRCRVSHLNRII